MVGRQRELDVLCDTVDQVLDAGARIVVIAGEAGIGKSRLLQAFTPRAVARGMRVLAAWCHETEQPLPFRPWVDAFREGGTAGDETLWERPSPASRASLVRLFPELGRPDERPATTGDEHALLFDAVSELLRLLGGGAPLLIVLEDLQNFVSIGAVLEAAATRVAQAHDVARARGLAPSER
jgi:hypothetical protein